VRILFERRRPERSSIAAFSIAQVREDQPHVLPRGIRAQPHLLRQAWILARLLDALAAGVVAPAVIPTAEAVALDPADGELGAAMGAAEVHHVGRAVLAAVEGEALA